MTRKPGARRIRPVEQQRRAARLAAVQALYQMDLAGTDLSDVIVQFQDGAFADAGAAGTAQPEPPDKTLFRELTEGVVARQQQIDRDIHATLARGWKLARLDATLRAILRAGAYELAWRDSVTAKTVINEYLEIAHAFYDADEPGFVNGVLDALARRGQGGASDHAGIEDTKRDAS